MTMLSYELQNKRAVSKNSSDLAQQGLLAESRPLEKLDKGLCRGNKGDSKLNLCSYDLGELLNALSRNGDILSLVDYELGALEDDAHNSLSWVCKREDESKDWEWLREFGVALNFFFFLLLFSAALRTPSGTPRRGGLCAPS